MSAAVGTYVAVCALDAIPRERGVAALVDGTQVAVFRTHDDEVHALGNVDPFSNAAVLARGIVGSRGEAAVVSSPMFKHAFDLATGECLDEPGVRVPVHDVAVADGVVLVGPERRSA